MIRVTGWVAAAALLSVPWLAPDMATEEHATHDARLAPPAPEVPSDIAGPSRRADDSFMESDAGFSVSVGRLDVSLRVLAFVIEPGREIEIGPESTGARLLISGDQRRLRGNGPNRWIWRAPSEPGVHVVTVATAATGDSIQLTFLVGRSRTDERDGVLNGYRIGNYRARPASMTAAYEPPRAFIEARPADYDIRVSPNFTLGQFLCKDPGDPRYLLVTPRLLIKLEAVLAEVREAGHAVNTLTVMSGFRTPAYNRAIGNTTDFSRHLWGDAADVYVDADRDDQMDDLNGDGRSDVRDARWLGRLVERLMSDPELALTPGGLAAYRRNAAHGPFLHIDTRGRPARW